ncbi:sigma 54-interacting transcriptional regulator [Candidatus Latescibacterota bacterium]
MDENKFFREITLRICGNLEIEKAMVSFLQYVQDYIPADRLFLEYYDKNERAMRTIADATVEKGKSIDLITPLSEEARNFLKKKYGDGIPPPYYYEKPYEIPVARELLDFHKQDAESIMVLPLGTSTLPVGIVTLISTHSQYNDKHLGLMSLLKEPFQVAMSNALKHRNELRLFDRDFFFEVTRHICGNLEIEEGLHACIQYISQFMPADRMYLQRYHSDLDSMHLIARADKEHYEKMDKLVPFGKEAKNKLTELAQVWRDGKLPPILTINDPADEPVTKCMLEALNEPMSSALSLPLVVGNTIIGTLVLLAEGNNRYSKENAELFSVLKLPFFVALSNTLKHLEVLKLKDMLADDNRYLHAELRRLTGDEIIGADFGLKEVLFKARQVAALDSPVLLLGETGVGKDVIANAIHYSSSRSEGPFVKINCGAIPDSLIDSELFGHEKGSFTGALSQKRGRFERADTGTIFLDEIGELPLEAQVRLLNVLQNKEIERVGGTKTILLDIRIIAATNLNLEKMVREQQFREDLWFRLNVFPILIPPLRERISDIPALLQHFITSKSKELKLPSIPSVSPGAIDFLMEYSWPGNVRELQNVIERELILNPKGPLGFNDLKLLMNKGSTVLHDHISETYNLDEINARHIRRVLSITNGQINGPEGAAELLGINANTLRNRMNKLGINYKKYSINKGGRV